MQFKVSKPLAGALISNQHHSTAMLDGGHYTRIGSEFIIIGARRDLLYLVLVGLQKYMQLREPRAITSPPPTRSQTTPQCPSDSALSRSLPLR